MNLRAVIALGAALTVGGIARPAAAWQETHEAGDDLTTCASRPTVRDRPRRREVAGGARAGQADRPRQRRPERRARHRRRHHRRGRTHDDGSPRARRRTVRILVDQPKAVMRRTFAFRGALEDRPRRDARHRLRRIELAALLVGAGRLRRHRRLAHGVRLPRRARGAAPHPRRHRRGRRHGRLRGAARGRQEHPGEPCAPTSPAASPPRGPCASTRARSRRSTTPRRGRRRRRPRPTPWRATASTPSACSSRSARWRSPLACSSHTRPRRSPRPARRPARGQGRWSRCRPRCASRWQGAPSRAPSRSRPWTDPSRAPRSRRSLDCSPRCSARIVKFDGARP